MSLQQVPDGSVILTEMGKLKDIMQATPVTFSKDHISPTSFVDLALCVSGWSSFQPGMWAMICLCSII